MPELRIDLPPLLLDDTLSRCLSTYLAGNRINNYNNRFLLNWANVRFFEDSALLTLLMIERTILRSNGSVRHLGFADPNLHNLRHLIYHLNCLEFIDLISSNHFAPLTHTRAEDLGDLIDLDPCGGLPLSFSKSPAMRIIHCNAASHFGRGTHERNKLELFENSWHRQEFIDKVTALPTCWDLVEDGTFRTLILEQTLGNIEEHAGEFYGLSVARIIRRDDIARDWNLTTSELNNLFGSESHIAALFKLDREIEAILQVTVIDDGPGIPEKLRDKLKALRRPLTREFFDKNHEDRFGMFTRDWTKLPEAELCAFAFDPDGSSKPFRFKDKSKGLTQIKQYVRNHRGVVIVRSDAGMLELLPSMDNPCGKPGTNPCRWCHSGGTFIKICLPLRSVPNAPQITRPQWQPISTQTTGKTVICSVRDIWDIVQTKIEGSDARKHHTCASELVGKIQSLPAEKT
jgi:hypothetical protein